MPCRSMTRADSSFSGRPTANKSALQNSRSRPIRAIQPGLCRSQCFHERCQQRDKHSKHGRKKAFQPQAHDRAQQPADVVARRTQHRVQRVPRGTLEPAAIHAVIVLQVPDRWLHRLAPLEPSALRIGQAFELAAVDDWQKGDCCWVGYRVSRRLRCTATPSGNPPSSTTWLSGFAALTNAATSRAQNFSQAPSIPLRCIEATLAAPPPWPIRCSRRSRHGWRDRVRHG